MELKSDSLMTGKDMAQHPMEYLPVSDNMKVLYPAILSFLKVEADVQIVCIE